jgi:hypothetical protein
MNQCPWSLVAVYWTDAFDSSNGWIDMKDYKAKPCHVVSVGFLWPDILEGYISITGSYMPDELPDMETVGMVTHIPVGMVNKVVVLTQPEWVGI